MTQNYPVHIKPLFGNQQEMMATFRNDGFSDILYLNIFANYAFAGFEEKERAEDFIRFYDNRKIKDVKIFVAMGRGRQFRTNAPPPPPPPPSRPPSRTIKIRGFPPSPTIEQNLFNEFRDLGFIRHVENRGDTSFIQFDTEQDAENAIRSRDGKSVSGKEIFVESTPDFPMGLPHVYIPLVPIDNKCRRIQTSREPFRPPLKEGRIPRD